MKELAARIGVELLDTEAPRERTPWRSPGPAGGACDIKTRQVWTGELFPLEPFELLHEIMHIYLALPRRPLARQPCEGRLLMQVERAIAEETFDDEEIERCIDWQENTGLQTRVARGAGVRGPAEYFLRDAPPWYWQRGVAIAQRIGVLDTNGRPTYAPPDWRRLTKADRAYLRYARS